MRSFIAMFAATSTAGMSWLTSEPISMLLWGVTLLSLGAVLRRHNLTTRTEPSDSQQIGSGPSLATRT